jgi:hypothetical protein
MKQKGAHRDGDAHLRCGEARPKDKIANALHANGAHSRFIEPQGMPAWAKSLSINAFTAPQSLTRLAA